MTDDKAPNDGYTTNSNSPSLRSRSASSLSEHNINSLSYGGNESLSSMVPETVLKRLTPLKRTKLERSLNESSITADSAKSIYTHKVKLIRTEARLSNILAAERVEQLKRMKEEHAEQKRKEIEEKQLNAERIRNDNISKKREAAGKFARDKLIHGIHKVKADDIEVVSSDGSETSSERDQSYSGSSNSIEVDPLLVKYANIIKGAFRRKHAVAFLKHHPLIIEVDRKFGHKKLVKKGWRPILDRISDSKFREFLKWLLNSLEIPSYDDSGCSSLGSTIAALLIFWSNACYTKPEINYNLDTDENILHLGLGELAKEVYSGYGLKDFEKLHYYDDKFSSYILQKVVHAAEIFLVSFKRIIFCKIIPSRSDNLRLDFIKDFKNFTNLLYLFKDDHSKRLFMVQLKVLDDLLSSLAIQKHISNSSDLIHNNLSSETKETTKLLETHRADALNQLSQLKITFNRYRDIYNSQSFSWINNNNLDQSRSYIYEEYKLELNIYLFIGSKIVVPFGFTPHSWIEHQYEKLNKIYDDKVKGSGDHSIPRSMKSGRLRRGFYKSVFESILDWSEEKKYEIKKMLLNFEGQEFETPEKFKWFAVCFLTEILNNSYFCNTFLELPYSKPIFLAIDEASAKRQFKHLRADQLMKQPLDGLTFIVFNLLSRSYKHFFLNPSNSSETELIKIFTQFMSERWQFETWIDKKFDMYFLLRLMRAAWKRICSLQYCEADVIAKHFLPSSYGGSSDTDLNLFTYFAFYWNKDSHFLFTLNNSSSEIKAMRCLLISLKRDTMKIFPLISFDAQDYRQQIIECILKLIIRKIRSIRAPRYTVRSLDMMNGQLDVLLNRLKILLQAASMQNFLSRYFFMKCPLLQLGKTKHFRARETMQVLYPGSVSLTETLYDHFKDKIDNNTKDSVQVDDQKQITDIVKMLVSQKIEEDYRLSSIFDDSNGDDKYDRATTKSEFLHKNFNDNKFLSECISKCSDSESFRDRVMFLVFKSVGYEMEYPYDDTTKLFNGKCEGIADDLMYDFKRLIDVNLDVFDVFYKEAYIS
ncbi:hypothetical protein BN7_1107 [Wickerhamomyces ciferrii]|uniref:Uncharacterized protein n=1 Tax=Wickerhamomyces ciferrii (strain ATCC 14091 / BCRC 22168 / CBS 111 / JCM 3599 / NBRC 0793 / NRRL Y-1031 F-60-10) TaxID=1206466 RepID=K0KF26_WICCF|nr:uncharacterized protein BN7_1107 [Wickerhamomyces ciferrii]CCH41566.1 hypothetical protein BN7_1107 [Wickerhamomyces ciferrii]